MSGFVSARGRRITGKRLVWTLVVCALGCAVVAALAPLIGVTLDGKLELFGPSAYDPASPDHAILAVRLPRVAAALLVGAALGGAGCALQALLRNPLAEPYTLGISSGSSLAAVIALHLGLAGALGGWAISLAALGGALAVVIAVERLARVGRHLPPATLVLAGATVSMVCSAVSVILQIVEASRQFSEATSILIWMVGGFESSRLVQAQVAAIPIGIALFGLVACSRSLDALAAGPELAASLGVAVGRTQVLVFALTSVLVGVSVALAGPIGFIGLVVPHALRALLGPDHRVLLPASMFGGAALLVVCDTIGRTAISTHLPAGAVTAVLGGVFFLGVLAANRRRAAMWGR
jgi:iron complex transport system permease protein